MLPGLKHESCPDRSLIPGIHGYRQCLVLYLKELFTGNNGNSGLQVLPDVQVVFCP